ncbi:MAG TPA: ABC transporter permease [Gemmatimonadales bacterium]|nr:ABC transporter permease [Gemmatimonadales bacterium]
MDLALLTAFLASAVRVATPLLFAALGETISERGGVINLGIEGAMLAGALAAALGAQEGGVWAGTLAALLAGMLVAGLFALIAVRAGADQIITGTALTLGAVGLTGAISRRAFGSAGVGLTLPTFPALALPGLSRIPVLGPAIFTQSVLTYLGFLAVPLFWWVLFRTRWGLELRATGESARNSRAAGVRVGRMRTVGVLIAGGMAGLGGASLVLAQVGTFAEKMTAGRGFIAIAIVVLGAWNPARVLAAALFFGAAMALQFLFQSLGSGVPYQLFLMLPYLLTLATLAGAWGRTAAPADLGKSEEGEG